MDQTSDCSAPKLVWIQTRDQSPTLWHNELGESFRSSKGAFTESLHVFVLPAIKFAVAKGWKKITVGEFGLGVGTNYLLLNCAALHAGIEVDYFAIERDTEAFTLGMERWKKEASVIGSILNTNLNNTSAPTNCAQLVSNVLDNYQMPKVFLSLSEATAHAPKCDAWFHDPFGFAVNPDGYTKATIQECSGLWNPSFIGLSYACNTAFQRELLAIDGVELRLLPIGVPPLKRERLEWSR